MAPARYLGVDMVEGPGVDEILDVSALVRCFGPDSFDVVISTEMIEHLLDWRDAVTSLKRVVRGGGTLLLTTRSLGFPYHGFPYDFWRYELSDMAEILSDFKMEALESDPLNPGVFVKATKPTDYVEANLDDIRLYSILTHRRMRSLSQRSARFLVLNVWLKQRSHSAARTIVPDFVRNWIRRR
jgi:2-polyprenyl-3-methyl-5-hydroxy-6-metoxy-1,4-benzoquinol methylase